MGLLNDLRNKRIQRTRVEINTEILGKEFNRDLEKDDLSDMIQRMHDPEVHIPLFTHAEAFGRQPEMDDVLRAQFRMRALDILGDPADSTKLNTVMERFNRTAKTDDMEQDNTRLVDKLALAGQNDEPLMLDRIAQRIQDTRQDIDDRVAHQKQKVKQVSRNASYAIERRLRPLADVAEDSVKGIVQSVKTRVQSFKDDYRTRQLAFDNAQNWETALDKGVSEEQIKNVIEHADFPEVRYGVMKHATKLFEQDSMTPELATDLFYAYQPHTNAQNKNHERFYKQLESYANSVVEQSLGDTSPIGPSDMPSDDESGHAFDPTVVTQPSESDTLAATTTLMSYSLANDGQSTYVSEELRDELDEHLTFAGYNKDSENVWEHRTDDGTVMIDDDQAEGIAMVVYTNVVTQNMIANANIQPAPKSDSLLSEYGSSNVVKFENSHTLSRLMARNGIDTLPELQRTSDDIDIRQAQLLGINDTGDAVWGVPDNGDIRHLSDDELEDAFMEQYGKTITGQDIPLPDHRDEPAATQDNDSFFDQMADAFNEQWSDEDALMQEGAPLPDEQNAPPAPDDEDIPPLSFDGLDEQDYEQKR